MSDYRPEPANFQYARAGDSFTTGHVNARVVRVSRHPERPWVDIYCEDAQGFTWSKRMPWGIPVAWTRSEVSR